MNRNGPSIHAAVATTLLAASFGAAAHAAITTSVASSTPVGTSTNFAATSANGGALALSTVNGGLGAGGTLAGGVSQGSVAGGAVGETFYGLSGNLAAITETWFGSASSPNTYRPFLFDLGAGPISTYGTAFNPSIHANLLDGTTLATFPAVASLAFIEIDFAGDPLTLDPTHSYAFGLFDTTGSTSGFIDRANGLTTDPNGVNFQFTGDPGTATSATSAAWGGGVRNMFVGVYTKAVPEPASLSVLALGAIGLLIRKRHA